MEFGCQSLLQKHEILTVGVSASINVVLSRKHSSALSPCTEKYHNNVTGCLLFSCKTVQFDFHTGAHLFLAWPNKNGKGWNALRNNNAP